MPTIAAATSAVDGLFISSSAIRHTAARDACGTRASSGPRCAPGASEKEENAKLKAPALCAEAEYRTDDGNVNVIAFRPEWPDDYPPSAYAVTTVWHRPSDGEILDADVEINDEAFPWAVCPDRGCPEGEDGLRDVDLQNVLTHELGHFFGIAHSNFLGTAMDARSPRGETTKRILAEKRAEFEASQNKATNDDSGSDYPANATMCGKCSTKAVIVMDGCATCLSCGDSKCG